MNLPSGSVKGHKSNHSRLSKAVLRLFELQSRTHAIQPSRRCEIPIPLRRASELSTRSMNMRPKYTRCSNHAIFVHCLAWIHREITDLMG